MGVEWAAIPDQGGIAKSLLDAKGDLIVASGADDTPAKLTVGTNTHVLTANSGGDKRRRVGCDSSHRAAYCNAD